MCRSMQGERVLRPSRATSVLLVFFEAWELGPTSPCPPTPGRTVVEDERGPQSTRKHSRKQLRTGCQDGGCRRGWGERVGADRGLWVPVPGPAQRHTQKLPAQPCDQQRPAEDQTWPASGQGARQSPGIGGGGGTQRSRGPCTGPRGLASWGRSRCWLPAPSPGLALVLGGPGRRAWRFGQVVIGA